MSKRIDTEFLSDIHEAVKRIVEYGSGLSYEAFLKDTKTQDAVIRNFEIIGEATKGLSVHLKQRYPHVQWSDVAKMRDKLIHHYFGVNIDVVWDIIEESLPEFYLQIEDILKKEMDH